MTKEEYYNNEMQINASIMIGALLQNAAASIDVLLAKPNFDKKNLPEFMELARALYDSAGIIQERVADSNDINRAMKDINVVINKILTYREDLQ